MALYCGFDFGTSNTVVTLFDSESGGMLVTADSSVLFLPDCGSRAQERYVGSEAVERYIASGMKGRFIQSIKTSLSDPGFGSTVIYEKRYTPEELVAMIVRSFKDRAELSAGHEIRSAVFGRPVRFAEESERDALAENRLRSAAERCGFTDIRFSYEPVAASARYAKDIPHGSYAMVCDFGGGTSDFSVVRGESGAIEVLASHGVRVGGDDLEGEVMWNRLIAYFGYGTEYESYGKMLPVPVDIYRTICRWERIPFLKTSKIRDDLRYIRNGARDRGAVERLIALIDDDLGYALFSAIKTAKHALSGEDSAAVRFFEHGIEMKERILLHEFDEYIDSEVARLDAATAEVLERSGVKADRITAVFLTGGSSAVRAIRETVRRRFPGAEVKPDTERFNSVALGLALLAREQGLTAY